MTGRLVRMVFTWVLVNAVVMTASAQFPGMNEEATAPSNAATMSVGDPGDGTSATAPDLWSALWQKYMAVGSPYRPVILTVLTLLVLLNLKAYLTRLMRRKLKREALEEKNVIGFLRVWNVLWKFVIAVLVIMAMSGSLRLLGLTAGFFGMMLGWSLQQPVTGIAAWLMIVLKKPFKIGDRVVIAGITGDVTSLTLTHVILNQVGGSIGGEERSGRGILIPNAILFQHTIINYTLDQKFMLDEVPVRLTFDSDWDTATAIMVKAASEVTKDIISETGQQPFVRAEFLDWGILVRLRYQTVAVNRQEISTNIIQILLRRFKDAYPKVKFAIPSQSIRYRPDAWSEALPADTGVQGTGHESGQEQ